MLVTQNVVYWDGLFVCYESY